VSDFNGVRPPAVTPSAMNASTLMGNKTIRRTRQTTAHALGTRTKNLDQSKLSTSQRNGYAPRQHSSGLYENTLGHRPNQGPITCNIQPPMLNGEFFRNGMTIPPPRLPPLSYPENLDQQFYRPHFDLFPPVQPYQSLTAQALRPMNGPPLLKPPWIPPSYAQVVAALISSQGPPPGLSSQPHFWYPTPQMGHS
jgi:hypothetical protein